MTNSAIEGVHHFLTESISPEDKFQVGRNRDLKYHPEVNYFMVAYTGVNERNAFEWFRHSWIPQEELGEVLLEIASDSELHNDFKVFSEDYLSLPRDNFEPELKCYVPDILSNRVFYFDSRYENVV